MNNNRSDNGSQISSILDLQSNNRLFLYITIIIALLFLAFNSFFTVDQRQTALILQFGSPVREILDPGLKMKIPFIQDVVYFDKRVQSIYFKPEGSNKEVMAVDQKTMKLTAYAKYRIVDPLIFYEKTKNEVLFSRNITPIIESSIREVVGTFQFNEVLGEKRGMITKKIFDIVKQQAKGFGVDIIDVRIIRINLPDQAKKAVYERMRTDREKEASEIRAKGAEEAQKIKAAADREKIVMLAEATREAEILRGEGEASALSIISGAASSDPDFFAFYRSMNAYRNALSGSNTTGIISLDNQFLRYIR